MRAVMSAALASVLASVAVAGEVPVPGEGWSIRFESPILLSHQEKGGAGADYAYQGRGERFVLTVYSEKPKGPGSSHADCHAYYWAKMSRNPRLDAASVKTKKTKRFVRVEYDLVAEADGRPERRHNVNYFFAYRGRWADVHFAVSEPGADDAAVFAAFDKSLSYGPAPKDG